MRTLPVIPLLLAERAALKAGDVTEVMLFPIGEWAVNSPVYMARYPKGLPLTQDTADSLVANFDAGVLGTDVQFSLAGVHDVPAPAAFWVQRVYCAPYEWDGRSGDACWCSARWTKAGAEAANDEQFKYVSIEAGDLLTNDGEQVPWVLQGGVLTNHPLIKIMPSLKDAPQALAASDGARKAEFEIDLALLAEAPGDPVLSILDDMDALAAKADAALKGKKGMPVFRTMMSQARAKVSAHKVALAEGSFNKLRDDLEAAVGEATGDRCWVCDFGADWVVYEDASMSEPPHLFKAPYERANDGITLGQPVEVKRETTFVPVSDSSPAGAESASSLTVAAGKAGAGRGAHLAEGDAAQKGVDHHMKTVIQHLKLAEDATESDVLAAVVKLAEERDTAVTEATDAKTKLAETEKAKRAGEVEVELAEIEKAGNLKAGEKAEFVRLSEEKPEIYAARLGERKALKVNTIVDLGTRGSGSEGDGDATKRADVELYELASLKMAELQCDYEKAAGLVLSENKGGIADRYRDFTEGREG